MAAFVLSHYMIEAMKRAVYTRLRDKSYAGHIPVCPGVVSFGRTPVQCSEKLRSVLEEWILVGLRLGHEMPIIANINLNQKIEYTSLRPLSNDGFEGPVSGTKHQFLLYGNSRLTVPYADEYSSEQLSFMLDEITAITGKRYQLVK